MENGKWKMESEKRKEKIGKEASCFLKGVTASSLRLFLGRRNLLGITTLRVVKNNTVRRTVLPTLSSVVK